MLSAFNVFLINCWTNFIRLVSEERWISNKPGKHQWTNGADNWLYNRATETYPVFETGCKDMEKGEIKSKFTGFFINHLSEEFDQPVDVVVKGKELSFLPCFFTDAERMVPIM